MRKILLAVLAAVLFLLPAHAVHASTQDFSIDSFTGDYYLSRDTSHVSQLRITEKIVADFPAYDQNHGILRAIPQSYQNHSLELHIQSVTDQNGTSWPYTISTDNGNGVLQIGDAHSYVHGQQTYNIDYTMRGNSLNLADHDEFFWDINGDQWPQQFRHVTARVHIPTDLVSSLQDHRACYVGVAGSTGGDCVVTNFATDPDGSKLVVFDSSATVPPNQTMTVVLAFNQGTFAEYAPSAAEIQRQILMVAEFATLPFVTLVFLLINWFRRGRDPKGSGVIVPQYTPPKDLSVLGSSAVIKESFDSKAISATIIDLAVRHYIKIYEVKKTGIFGGTDYETELIKPPTDLRSEEKTVVTMLFTLSEPGTRVALSSLKNKLAAKSQQLGKTVDKQLTTDGYFRSTPERARLPYHITGIVLAVIGFFALHAGGSLWAFSFLLAGFILLAGAYIMPARTRKGVDMREYLFGVRDYMKLAEADRLKVLQSPHGELTEKIDVGDNKQLVKLYEKLLPYAMLFGIEKDWASEMAGLYQQAPDWYYGPGTFNAIWFASSLNSFSTSAATAFAPPSSSSSSGFGGGAGGGGGGGGGGGW